MEFYTNQHQESQTKGQLAICSYKKPSKADFVAIQRNKDKLVKIQNGEFICDKVFFFSAVLAFTFIGFLIGFTIKL